MIEVLISVGLFTLVITLLLDPLRSTYKSIIRERDHIEALEALDEAVYQFHARLFQRERPTFEQLVEVMKERVINGFTITTQIVEKNTPFEKKGSICQLGFDITATKGQGESSNAPTRRVYICVTMAP